MKKSNNGIILGMGILFLISAYLFFSVSQIKADVESIKQIPAISQSFKLQKILTNLQNLNETKGYTNIISLEELYPKDLEQLKEQQPVIYNLLPNKTIYRVVLSKQDKNLFVIYDLEENKILRLFEYSQMVLGNSSQ